MKGEKLRASIEPGKFLQIKIEQKSLASSLVDITARWFEISRV